MICCREFFDNLEKIIRFLIIEISQEFHGISFKRDQKASRVARTVN